MSLMIVSFNPLSRNWRVGFDKDWCISSSSGTVSADAQSSNRPAKVIRAHFACPSFPTAHVGDFNCGFTEPQ